MAENNAVEARSVQAISETLVAWTIRNAMLIRQDLLKPGEEVDDDALYMLNDIRGALAWEPLKTVQDRTVLDTMEAAFDELVEIATKRVPAAHMEPSDSLIAVKNCVAQMGLDTAKILEQGVAVSKTDESIMVAVRALHAVDQGHLTLNMAHVRLAMAEQKQMTPKRSTAPAP